MGEQRKNFTFTLLGVWQRKIYLFSNSHLYIWVHTAGCFFSIRQTKLKVRFLNQHTTALFMELLKIKLWETNTCVMSDITAWQYDVRKWQATYRLLPRCRRYIHRHNTNTCFVLCLWIYHIDIYVKIKCAMRRFQSGTDNFYIITWNRQRVVQIFMMKVANAERHNVYLQTLALIDCTYR